MADTTKLAALRVSADLDASGFTAGANEIDAAAKKAGAGAKSLGDTVGGLNTKLRPASDGIEKLKQRFIDGYGAAQNFERQLAVLGRAVDKGAISADQAEQALIGLNRQYGLTANGADLAAKGQHTLAAAADRANAVIARTPAVMRGANDSMAQFRRQNLGYQLMDIGQTAALGAPLAMIAAQQSPQILQLYAAQGGLNAAMKDFGIILGGVARVAGPVIAAVGLIYGGYKILEANSVAASLAISDTTRALADQAAPVGSLKGQINELAQIQAEFNKTLAESALTSTSATETIVSNSQREYDARKALLDLELILQEAKLRTQQADIALAGQAMRERIGGQVTTDTSAAIRNGFADPAINGGQPFVRLPDEMTGIQKTLDAIDADPAKNEIARMRAEMTLAELAVEKLREALAKPFDVGGDPLGDDYWSRFSAAQLAKQKALQDAYNPVPAFPNGVPIPSARPIDGGEDVNTMQKRIDLLRQEAGARSDLVAQIQRQQSLFQGQQDDIEKLRLEAQLVGANAQTRATMTAALEAEQRLRQSGIDLLSREGQAYKDNAVAMAEARLQIERSQAAYTSYQAAGSSAIDALTASTGTLQDRLKGAADAMLSWITDLTIANPLKNALFGTNLPTLGDLGKPQVPGGGMTSTATMTVTAGTVMVNGGLPSVPGIPGTTPGGGLADVLGYKPAADVNGVRPDLMAGGLVNSPVSQTAPTGGIEAYIRQSAITRGIDPDVAVRVAQSEGGLQSWNAQSQVITAAGTRENSWGPFQLYKDGGLGNRMMDQTGLDPAQAANGPAGIDFALDTASKEGWGAWYGARKAGISDWQGINRNPGIDPMTTNSTTSAMKQLSTSAATATKDISGLADSSQDAGQGLMSLIGGDKGAFPAAPTPPTTAANYFPPAPTAGFNPLSLFKAIPIFGPLMGKIFGFADGTDFAPGGVAMVGERGPELVNLPRGSQVIPNHKLGMGGKQQPAMGGRTKVDVGVSVDNDGNLQAYVQRVADSSALAHTEAGIRTYNDNVLPGRVQDVALHPDYVG